MKSALRYTSLDKNSEVRLPISLSVIGAGRVGKALAHRAHACKLATIVDVVCRTYSNAQIAVDFIGAGTPHCVFSELENAAIFMLAVPDDQLENCCEQLAASGRLGPHCVVFHCSGALPASILRSAVQAGAHVASVHPVRSFADPMHVAEHFAGTHCGIEGDPSAVAMLSPLFEAMGAIIVPLRSDSKSLYHAAAVFASNYVVSVLAVAEEAAIASGIPAEMALNMLVPLSRESIDNVMRLGPATALTGPIARGDHATVARQLQAVTAWSPPIGALYDALADATRRLVARRDIDTVDLNVTKK